MAIIIKETKKCDTRSNGGLDFNSSDVELETKDHIEAVNACCKFISNCLLEQARNHDYTKLGEYLPAFTEALKSGFKGKEFKGQDWWQIHINKERHHLNDKCPDDVNLVDIIEMICDCVSAGLARTGNVYDINISSDILQKAVLNTQKLLMDNIKVINKIEEK